jgi:release factor glutamine methyltransferase
VIVRLPGTYAPQHDTELLISTLRASGLAQGRRVLDICTGTGAVALAAAAAGASSVTAVDLSHRAVASARLNSRLGRADIMVRRGDLFAPVVGQRFDLVVCNPPYVPAATQRMPRHRRGRCWDAGCDGRALVDRVCLGVADVLAPGGSILITHTAVIDVQRTIHLLARQGLSAHVAATRLVPFGPVMSARTDLLLARGMIRPGARVEEVVVVQAITLTSAPAAGGTPWGCALQETDSTVVSDRLAG